ncbi:WD40/YVTN repeat-like-containing domain superfamily [Sesbania bispinosa]|nr:WD40/YVTN repeat-like-containing domain superfamily [Sesbania bispinosa]
MAEEYDEVEAEVEEEFSVWKKNTPLLCDLFIYHPLPWPSLTVHLLPSSPQPHSNPLFPLLLYLPDNDRETLKVVTSTSFSKSVTTLNSS